MGKCVNCGKETENTYQIDAGVYSHSISQGDQTISTYKVAQTVVDYACSKCVLGKRLKIYRIVAPVLLAVNLAITIVGFVNLAMGNGFEYWPFYTWTIPAFLIFLYYFLVSNNQFKGDKTVQSVISSEPRGMNVWGAKYLEKFHGEEMKIHYPDCSILYTSASVDSKKK